MKKLLAILVLSMLITGNTKAKEIVLECDYKEASTIPKIQGNRTYLINLTKKILEDGAVGAPFRIIVEKNYIGWYSFFKTPKEPIKDKNEPKWSAHLTKINRVSGDYAIINFYLTLEQFKKFSSMDGDLDNKNYFMSGNKKVFEIFDKEIANMSWLQFGGSKFLGVCNKSERKF